MSSASRRVWLLTLVVAGTILPPACGGGSGGDGERASGGATAEAGDTSAGGGSGMAGMPGGRAGGVADGDAAGGDNACECVDSQLCASGRDFDQIAALECANGRGLVTRQTLDCGMVRLAILDFDLGWTITFDESGRIVATSFRDGLSGAACDAGSELARSCRVTDECYVCGTNERWRDPAMRDCP